MALGVKLFIVGITCVLFGGMMFMSADAIPDGGMEWRGPALMVAGVISAIQGRRMIREFSDEGDAATEGAAKVGGGVVDLIS